jgi:hypothetical protein
MMEDQLPDRVRAAEQRREFERLLGLSSIGKPPKGLKKEFVPSGMCEVCRADRCDDMECMISNGGCACTCTADKETLAGEIATLLDQRGIWRNDDDPMEMAKVLYTKGYRRES